MSEILWLVPAFCALVGGVAVAAAAAALKEETNLLRMEMARVRTLGDEVGALRSEAQRLARRS